MIENLIWAACSVVGFVGGFFLGDEFGLTQNALLGAGIAGALIPQLARLTELSIDGWRISGKLGALEKRVEDAFKLADLASHSALTLSHLPQGAFFTDGFERTGHDRLRTAIAHKLDGIGLSEAQRENVFAIEDPFIAENIINSMIGSRAVIAIKKSNPGQENEMRMELGRLRNQIHWDTKHFPSMGQLRSILEKYQAIDPDVSYALDFYGDWISAKPRYKFVLERQHEIRAKRPKKPEYEN